MTRRKSLLHGATNYGRLNFKKKPPGTALAVIPAQQETQDEFTVLRRLTGQQVDIMNYLAFDGYAGGSNGTHNEMQALIDLQLIEMYYIDKKDREGAYLEAVYSMPISVHMNWCDWVSSKEYARKHGDTLVLQKDSESEFVEIVEKRVDVPGYKERTYRSKR